MEPSVSYHDELVKQLKDPLEACAYLNAAIEEEDRHHFLIALRNVAEAQGGLLALSKRLRRNRGHLYQMLSPNGNPEIDSLHAILRAFGFDLAVVPRKPKRRAA